MGPEWPHGYGVWAQNGHMGAGGGASASRCWHTTPGDHWGKEPEGPDLVLADGPVCRPLGFSDRSGRVPGFSDRSGRVFGFFDRSGRVLWIQEPRSIAVFWKKILQTDRSADYSEKTR